MSGGGASGAALRRRCSRTSAAWSLAFGALGVFANACSSETSMDGGLAADGDASSDSQVPADEAGIAEASGIDVASASDGAPGSDGASSDVAGGSDTAGGSEAASGTDASSGSDADASDAGGATFVPVTLCTVLPGTNAHGASLLDLGLQGAYTQGYGTVARYGDRMLVQAMTSTATGSTWTLWNVSAPTPALVAQGVGNIGSLAAGVFTIYNQPTNATSVYRASDGQFVTTVANPGATQISSDGTYVVGASYSNTSKGIAIYSATTGALLNSADLSSMSSFDIVAVPGELRVVGVPSDDRTGAYVVHVPTNGSPPTTSSPVPVGDVPSSSNGPKWFADGSRFIAQEKGARVVYALDGTPLGTVAGSTTWSAGGVGDYFYLDNSTIYELQPGGAAPVAVRGFNGYWYGPVLVGVSVAQVQIAHFDNDTLRIENQTLPTIGSFTGLDGNRVGVTTPGPSFGPNGEWGMVTSQGAVFFGGGAAGTSFGAVNCGNVIAMWPSASGRVAISTASGDVFVFDTTAGAPSLVTRTTQTTGGPATVRLSPDGQTLAVSSSTSTQLYDTASGQPFQTLPTDHADSVTLQNDNVEFVNGGTTTYGAPVAEIVPFGGQNMFEPNNYSSTSYEVRRIALSPTKAYAFLSMADPPPYAYVDALPPDPQFTWAPSSTFYDAVTGDASLLDATITGQARVWVDATHVLVDNYQYTPPSSFSPAYSRYVSTTLCTKDGACTASDNSLKGAIELYDLGTSMRVWTGNQLVDYASHSVLWSKAADVSAAAALPNAYVGVIAADVFVNPLSP